MLSVVTFYKFIGLPHCREMLDPIRMVCEENGVRGIILLAEEGINATIAGPPDGITNALDYICSYPELADLTWKTSTAATMPFGRLKIRVKAEIVTMKQPVDPSNLVGNYVEPKDWNALISREDVILIDTRNDYEYAAGTFKGAIDPKTTSFGQFPAYVETHLADKKDRPIAMFCTGGIRCEKATSFLMQQGFKEVYHLQGGILKYLEEVPATQSLWQGECFVFDEREALNHGLINKKK